MNASVAVAPGPVSVDPVHRSREAFRGCLSALGSPGAVVKIGPVPNPLPGLHVAASALLLSLLDQDTRLWLSPSIAMASTAMSLKIHTGCSLAASPGEADFALVGDVVELPGLDAFGSGVEEYPERNATVVLQVPHLTASGWRLSGPGVGGEARFCVPVLGRNFLQQWERNCSRFPRGVDLFISCGDELCGLPRTTHIEA
jgi:alpha-D-ribose 1-methylphosphonate 5-triphosphate synthase subunit PhnH